MHCARAASLFPYANFLKLAQGCLSMLSVELMGATSDGWVDSTSACRHLSPWGMERWNVMSCFDLVQVQ
eukprot:1156711-Pelagomonas_calceolata.AAC.5